MKVATLRLLTTWHFHLATLKISAGSSMRMSRLTFTWQASRQPWRASPGEMKPVSVGRMSPPPSRTMTSHTPQAPLPPQADGMKMPLADSAPSSVLPAGVTSARLGSSLITIETSPLATSLRRAPSSTATRARMTPVNISTATTTAIMADSACRASRRTRCPCAGCGERGERWGCMTRVGCRRRP